jgi:thiol-disulfide isomerase/thioredoxin
MSKFGITCAASAVLTLAGLFTAHAVLADAPTTAPAGTASAGTPPAVTGDAPTTSPAAAARTATEIDAEIQKTLDGVKENLLDPDAILDPAKRVAVAPKIEPPIHKILADLDELIRVAPDRKEMAEHSKGDFLTFLALCNDDMAIKALQAQADSKDPATAVTGQTGQLVVAWLAAAKDEAAQTKVADRFEKLAKAHPENGALSEQIIAMAGYGNATPALGDRMITIVTDDMKNDVAEERLAEHKAEVAAAQKIQSLEGKPLVISGTTPDGSTFSTADYKGKVILVDFWATWCGPCLAELPRVKKMYADYHGKGLEVLGVSNDFAAEDLSKFLAKNQDMPWKQLFDSGAAAKQQWNPITTGFGINGIPTMFLIDKKGILRTVNARQSMEQLIPQMLNEK